MKNVLGLIIGRRDEANFYRDVLFSKILGEEFKVEVFVPSKSSWNLGYSETDFKLLEEFSSENDSVIVRIFNSEEECLTRLEENCEILLVASALRWSKLIASARESGLLTACYSSYSGLDQHPLGEHICFLGSYYELEKNRSLRRFQKQLSKSSIYEVIGNLSLLGINIDSDKVDGSTARREAGDGLNALVMLKDPALIEERVLHWNRFRSRKFKERIILRIREIYQECITTLAESGVKLQTILHSGSRLGSEEAYKGLPIQVLDRREKYRLIAEADFLVSVTSTALIDSSIFRKPIIYYRSNDIPYPKRIAALDLTSNEAALKFACDGGTGLNLGASRWAPLFVGQYAKDVESLKLCALSIGSIDFGSAFDVVSAYTFAGRSSSSAALEIRRKLKDYFLIWKKIGL